MQSIWLNKIDTAEAMINLFDASSFYKQSWEPHLRAKLTALTLDHLSEVSNNDLTSILDWQVTEFTLQKGQLDRRVHTRDDGSLYPRENGSTFEDEDPISTDEYEAAIMSYRTQIAAVNTTPVMFSLQECRVLCTFVHVQGFTVDWDGPGSDYPEATYYYPLRDTEKDFYGHNRLYHYFKNGIYAYKNEHMVVGLRSVRYNLKIEAGDVEWFAWCDVEGWLEGSEAEDDSEEEEEEEGEEEAVEEGDDGDEEAVDAQSEEDEEESDDGAEEDQSDDDAAS